MSKQSGGPFKVLIAGGSLVGLSLALALEHAGVDYELFEKGDFAPQLGASIGLHPHSLRILDQLGVCEDIEKVVVPLRDRKHYDSAGYCFEDSQVLTEISQILMRPIIFMERSKALQILYDHIQKKSKLHAHDAVVGYEDSEDGVLITTKEGRTVRGDILVGADEIHSQVRRLMVDKISLTDPGLADTLGTAFTSQYNCIFGVSRNDPQKPFLPDAMVHNVYYTGYSAVAAAGVPGLVFWFLFAKATSVTRTPDCPRFSDQDAEVLIGRYDSAQVGPGYTVRDLWDARVKATMAPLEEGILEQWSYGRVVLMGDAVHKATINPGLGGNLAYEGIAHFLNGLIPLLERSPIPSLEELTELFHEFQSSQKPRARTVVDISGQITRYEALDTWLYRLAARCVVPWVPDRAKAQLYGNFSNGGPWLQYLPVPRVDKDHPRLKLQTSQNSPRLPGFITLAASIVAGGVLAVSWHKYGGSIWTGWGSMATL